MRLIFPLATLLFVSISATAQKWSLDSCINYAIQHNLTIKSRLIECQSAQYDVTEAKDEFLPQLNANASQSFNFGRGLTAENIYANRNTSNFQVGASLSLPIFQGLSAIKRIKYTKANLNATLEQYEAAKDDVTINVITAYLQALYTLEIKEVAAKQVTLSEHELQRHTALFEAGKIPEIDIYEAKSLLAQDQLTLVNADNDHQLAIVDLTQLLELDSINNFEILPIDESNILLSNANDIFNKALSSNHAILASKKQIIAADRNIDLAKTGYIPRLSFNAGIGSSYYNINGFENDNFSTQMSNNFNTYVGFTLSVPIFDAFSTRNSVRKAKVQKLNAQLQYEDTENQLYKTIQQAYYQAVAAKKKLESSIISEDAAQITFDATQEKYNLGRATSTDYEQSKTKLLTATAERIQAKYELILRSRILHFYSK